MIVEPTQTVAGAESQPSTAYLTAPSGLWSWVATRDHKRLALMYLFLVTGAFVFGGALALAIRLHLWDPAGLLFEPQIYNQVFTVHAAIMVFLFIIPGIPGVIVNFVLPQMLGAERTALPRLNLAAFYLWILGCMLVIYSLLTGAVDTGWTIDDSLSAGGSQLVLPLAVCVLGLSAALAGLNVIATVHARPAPSMKWLSLPMFVWTAYISAVVHLIAMPLIGVSVFYLAFGDAELGQFFWFYAHPAIYVMVLPAIGVITEIVSKHSQRCMSGYGSLVFSSIAIAVGSFCTWGHHLFLIEPSEFTDVTFSALTLFVAVPTTAILITWMTTLSGRSILSKAAMFYALAFIVVFAIGLLTAVFSTAMNIHALLDETYFETAQFHATMMGATTLAFFAGLHHWWPSMFGRNYDERAAKIAAAMITIGFVITFVPQFVMGSRGMPRRAASYLSEYQIYHQISTLGSLLLAAGFVLMLGYLLNSIFSGEATDPQPEPCRGSIGQL